MRSPFRAVVCVLIACLLPAEAEEVFRPLRGPYIGQVAPEEPAIFLPGKISTGANEGCSLFLPGARSFLWRTERGGKGVLLLLEDRDGRWQPPEPVALLDDESVVWDFTLSADGQYVYFTSDRAVHGAGRANLWRARIQDAGFGPAEALGPEVNSDLNDSYPSVTRDGELYFFRRDPEHADESDLYRAVPVAEEGKYETAVRLAAPVNGDYLDYDPFVAADGSYLIFSSRRPGGEGQGDLYISFAEGDGWSAPRNLGPRINSSAEENRPAVTLDGKHLFFTSNRSTEVVLPPGVPPARSMPGHGSRDIYWMRADFIDRLRPRE